MDNMNRNFTMYSFLIKDLAVVDLIIGNSHLKQAPTTSIKLKRCSRLCRNSTWIIVRKCGIMRTMSNRQWPTLWASQVSLTLFQKIYIQLLFKRSAHTKNCRSVCFPLTPAKSRKAKNIWKLLRPYLNKFYLPLKILPFSWRILPKAVTDCLTKL